MTMMRSSIGAVAAVVISCMLAGAAVAAGPQATITGVTPTTAVAGQMITISGTGLDGTQGVAFGNVQATPFVVDPAGSSGKVDVPSGVQVGQVTITLTGDSGTVSTPINIQAGSMTPQPLPSPASGTSGSNGTSSKLVRAPLLTLFSPAAGKVGSKVTILGRNFVGVSWVKLGGATAKFTVVSPSRLVVTVPRLAHTGKLSVHASAGTGISGKSFKVLRAAT